MALKTDLEKQKRFLETYFQVFLYSPDDVIKRLNKSLIAMGSSKPIDTDTDKAMKEAILAMRQVLYGESQLKSEDVLFPVLTD